MRSAPERTGPDNLEELTQKNAREIGAAVMDEKSSVFGLDQFLKSKGYELLKEIGDKEGNTRDVFLASYTSGSLKELRVVKVPKDIKENNSFYLIVNTTKRNIHENEAKMAGQIHSSHIAKTIDHFPYSEKNKPVDIIVEEYFNAQSLKSLVRQTGPLKDTGKIYNVFSQVAKGLKDLHNQGIIHRDIKGSNIIVSKDLIVKITDLQNSGNRSNIEDTLLPTRTESSHTHPRLLNAVLKGELVSTSTFDDIYAFGATIYEATTGQIPLDYKLALGGTEKLVPVNGKEYPVQLLVDGKPVSEIDSKMHEKKLKQALKKAPKSVRNIIYKCMTTTYKNKYTDITEALADIDKLQRPDGTKWLNRIYDSMKFGLGTAAGVFAGLGILYISLTRPETPPISQVELLKQRKVIEYNLDNRADNEYMWSILKDNADNIKKNIETLSEEKKSQIEWVSQRSSISGLTKRTAYSLVRAIMLADEQELEKTYKEREMPYCVPTQFIQSTYKQEKINDRYQGWGSSMNYFAANLRWSENIVENFASYFLDKNDLTIAMVKSKGYNYFPEADSAGNIKPGYYTHVMPVQKNLIENATLLYLLSDEEGNLDWNKMPTMVRSVSMSGSEADAYHIFKAHSDSAAVNR